MFTGSLSQNALASLIDDEPEGVFELVRDMREDYQIVLAEQVLRSNVNQARVTVEPTTKGDERADALAKELTNQYWAKLRSMLDCIAYGRVAFEKVWEYDKKLGLNTITLRELPYNRTERITRKFDGSFGGIKVKGSGDREVNLAPEYSWWLALDATPLQPHGRSRFLGAPERQWQDRNKARQLMQTFTRRFALGSGIIHAPMTFEDPQNPNGPPLSTQEYLAKSYGCLEAGGFVLVPPDRHQGADGKDGDYLWDLNRFEVEVRSGQPILEIINAMDGWQLLAFGIPPKTVMEGDAVGSFALVTQQMLILLAVVEEIVAQIVESYQKYVVDKCAEMNMPGVKLTVNFMPLTERPDDLANEIVKSWLTTPALSPIIEQGLVDVVAILESSGVAVSQDAGKKFQSWIDAKAKMAQAAQDAMLNGDPGGNPGGGTGGEQEREPPPPLELSSPFLGKLWNLDCGTGTGGFKPGNRCGLENGDSRTNIKRKLSGKLALRGSVKAQIAKASAKRVDYRIQRYAEGVAEPQLAKKLGGKSLDDNEPADVLVFDAKGKVKHGIELKTMVDNGNAKITMKRSAMDRKADWEKKNRAKMHTVVYDDHAVFNAKGEGKHDFSKRKIYYRRGYGSFRVKNLFEVKGGEEELKILLDTPLNKLTKAAGGTR